MPQITISVDVQVGEAILIFARIRELAAGLQDLAEGPAGHDLAEIHSLADGMLQRIEAHESRETESRQDPPPPDDPAKPAGG